MASVPSNPVDVQPFQIQQLISDVGKLTITLLTEVTYDNQASSGSQIEVLCAQAFGASFGRTTTTFHLLKLDTQDRKSMLDALMGNSFALHCKLTIQIK